MEATLCAADILLTLGAAERAYETASGALAAVDECAAGAELTGWAFAVLGDAARESGRSDVARRAYESARDRSDRPVLAFDLALADLLIAEKAWADAFELLQSLPQVDAVLLRRALLAVSGEDSNATDLVEQLAESFNEEALSGAADLHLRERAMFELLVRNDADSAIVFAKRNWAVQKGWEDARLLLDAAAESGDRQADRDLAEWRSRQLGSL